MPKLLGLYPLPPAQAIGDRTLKSLPLRHTVSKSKHRRDGVPPKNRKPAISE